MTDDANVHDQRPDETPLQPQRAVRLLRAKAHELMNVARDGLTEPAPDAQVQFALLATDIALIAMILADYMEAQVGEHRAVHLLRARAAKLETMTLGGAAVTPEGDQSTISMLMGDIALVATLLADHIQRANRGGIE